MYKILPFLFVALIACDDEQKDDTSNTETDTDTDTDSDSDTDTDTDTDVATGTMTGTLLDDSSQPVEGVDVQICGNYRCVDQITDSNGDFTFTELVTTNYALHFDKEGYAHGLIVVAAENGQETNVKDSFLLPWQDTKTVTSNSQVEAGDFLTLDVKPSEVVLPIGVDDLVIMGTFIGPQFLPDLEILEGDVVGLWNLGIFDSYMDVPMGFVVDNSMIAVPANTQLKIMEVNYLNAEWVESGTATVSSDGTQITSDSGSGLTMLTTMALVK